MKSEILFIYAKDEKILAVVSGRATDIHDKLLKDGWVHTHTLDAEKFIEYLHNDCEMIDMVTTIRSLSKNILE